MSSLQVVVDALPNYKIKLRSDDLLLRRTRFVHASV